MNQRLINETAAVMAQHLVELLGSCLREEERRDAFEEFYAVCRAGLEAFCVQQNRIQQHLHPTAN